VARPSPERFRPDLPWPARLRRNGRCRREGDRPRPRGRGRPVQLT